MPSTVNNTARAMMGSLKRWRDQSQPTVTATGSGNAQIITYPVAPAALASGDTFAFFSYGNTGAATLQVNAQAAKPIMTSIGTPLVGGEMPAGAAVMVVYDGTNFRMLAAPTPLSISNGGTGQTTPAAAADAIGAVKDTGDTMTGTLAVPNIAFTGTAHPGNTFMFDWDGQVQMYVNGAYVGAVGDISSVAAGNGLTGGGTSGALTLAMSGSYSGSFSASASIGAAFLTSSGNGNIDGLLNAGSLGVFNNAQVNGNINANGNLSVGDQIQCRHFYASGDYAAGDWKFYVTNEVWCGRHFTPSMDGGVYCGLAAYAWALVEAYSFVTKSDPALKRDIAPVPPGCLELVNAIEPKTYKLKLEIDEGRTHWGFLAPEVGEAMRRAGHKFDAVRTEGDAPSSLAYNEMIAVLWGAVQELSARVEALTR